MLNELQQVQERLRSWVPPRSRILCAISGGPDSVALAHVLKNSFYEIYLGHVDHQLRETSGRDARFVETLARQWALPLTISKVSVDRYARSRNLGVEEAARELRYQALMKMAQKTGCSWIVTAHTADDQAETVLMNFLRGTGPQGLAGIPPQRSLTVKITVLRPLLGVSRETILQYLQTYRLPSRQDPSNRSNRFTRNRIRHRVLPSLEASYPGLKQRLIQLADIFREEEIHWAKRTQREFDKTVRRNGKNITIDLTQLLGYHKTLGRRILRRLLKGLSFQDTERVLHLARFSNGKSSVQLPGGVFVQRKHNELIVHSKGLYE